MRGLRWRRAQKSDLPALGDFLKQREERRVGFSGRLLSEGRLSLPSPLRGAVWLADSVTGPAIAGAILCHPSRLAFPIFPQDTAGDRDLGLLAKYFSPASVIGMAEDVVRYELVMGFEPKAIVRYVMMSHDSSASTESRNASIFPYPSLSIRAAVPADLEALLPLQEAYEREEVLTSIHDFNRAACKASLARALERQIMLVAEECGVIVGKAATNARGFGVDQIGGVYTMPERRGRGVARALLSELLARIGRSGRRASLFVKPTNVPARELYLGLGFEDGGEYLAHYYEA